VRKPILFLGDYLPGKEELQGFGSPDRARALIKSLLTVLATPGDGEKPRYDTITCLMSQNDELTVGRQLRIDEDEVDLREPQRPYLFYGGGPVLRFQRDEPAQELIIVPTQKTFVASSDFDPLAAKTLRQADDSPGIFVFDITRKQWEDITRGFETVRAPNFLSDEQARKLLQIPPPEEPTTVPASE